MKRKDSRIVIILCWVSIILGIAAVSGVTALVLK